MTISIGGVARLALTIIQSALVDRLNRLQVSIHTKTVAATPMSATVTFGYIIETTP